MAKEPCTPECLWAERKEFIFLTVQVSAPDDLKVDLKEKSLDVSCTKGDRSYACHLDFPEEINVEESKYSTQRNIQFKLVKKEAKRWHKVSTADKKKLHWLKCDWNKWVDSDEEENAQMNMDDFDMDAMNFGGMGGMGGMGGLGGLGGLGGMGGMGGMDLSSLGANADFGDEGDSDDEGDLNDLDAPLPDEENTKEAAQAEEDKPAAEAES